jgi:hypothetical protein
VLAAHHDVAQVTNKVAEIACVLCDAIQRATFIDKHVESEWKNALSDALTMIEVGSSRYKR